MSYRVRTGPFAGYTSNAMKASRELEDGRILEIKFICTSIEGTFDDPPDSDCGEYTYYLDGEETGRDDLPPECTDEFIDRLAEDAELDPTVNLGNPD